MQGTYETGQVEQYLHVLASAGVREDSRVNFYQGDRSFQQSGMGGLSTSRMSYYHRDCISIEYMFCLYCPTRDEDSECIDLSMMRALFDFSISDLHQGSLKAKMLV